MSKALERWLAGVLLAAFVAGSAMAEEPDAKAQCLAGAPPGLETYWAWLCKGNQRDMVLHQMRAGQAAFAAGHYRVAEEQLDAALGAIEAVYADNEAAEKARSVWHAEKTKDFKGEPYERVMAYHYRGLLYLMAGDFDNAQASFKGAVLQDSFAATERFRSDVASQVWLEGWARRCQGAGSAADELFAEAASIRPDLRPPPAGSTVLVVAETGSGPRKSAIGQYSEKLVIREGSAGNDKLVAVLSGSRAELAAAENLFYQATTRGGREMDNILAEKAETKRTTQTVGSAAMAAGAATVAVAQSQHQNNNNNNSGRAAGAIGGGIMLLGLLAMAASAGMNPAADTRTWDTLPHSIHLATLPPATAAPGLDQLDLQDGTGYSVLDRSRLRTASHPVCSLAWAGSGSLLPSRMPVAAVVAEAPPAGPPTCRTPSGTERALPLDVCRRIGGTPLEQGPPATTAGAPASADR